MITVHINENDLMKWLAYLKQVKANTPRAVANGLNVYGEGLIRNISQYVAEETGLDDDDVAGLIEVDWATPENLTLSIDATEAMAAVSESDWSRPWDARDQKQYQKETLVKIVTLADGHDCLVCQDAAEHSPYSMAEIRNMQAKWANYQGSTTGPAPGVRTNLVHPNCRCVIQPWYSTRKLPVTVGSSRTPPELFNLQEMSRLVIREVKAEFNVK